ncbi:MAG: lipase maturation factor family protein [Chloroflexota bacterium]|nr:lipase maturation factor family protein [Chloroflexota bacterium]
MNETPSEAKVYEVQTGKGRNARPAGLWRALSGPLARHEYVLTRWLFLRGLGLVYLFAFGSLGTQILGLVGSRGILPASAYLHSVASSGNPNTFWLVPTLAWINSSDAALLFLCWGGAALALLLVLGLLPGPLLALLWLFYLSLANIGQDFLGFQWDALLLEAGLLAIFFAPMQLWWGVPQEVRPSRTVLWLLRLLLFRLMFFSGVVKLASGDPTWHDLTALTYHYWTQPLPNPIAWYMNQIPLPFQEFSTLATLVIEMGAPFLIFGPRRVRLLGAALLVMLQLFIMLTGNFAFFNVLSIVLCILLLDDTILVRLISAWPARTAWLRKRIEKPAERDPRFLLPRRIVTTLLAVLIVGLTWTQVESSYFSSKNVPAPLYDLAVRLSPFDVVNSYGLFAVMTTSRPEIVVEGSADGKEWREYEFRYKPVDVNKAPAFVAPHQPRLDWQMWFAALSGSADDPSSGDWFSLFMRRLLQGSPDVLGLLGKNPFPAAPPRYIRAQLYSYTFTRFGTPGGGWWRRESKDVYFPATALDSPGWPPGSP